MAQVKDTAFGIIQPATPQEIAREDSECFLITDPGRFLLTDGGFSLVPNFRLGYTNPDLHRRIDVEAEVPNKSVKEYGLSYYDENGNPYDQTMMISVWDGIHSYRMMETFTHDEESLTCEIP